MITLAGQDIGKSRAYTTLVIVAIKDQNIYVKDVIQWPHTNKPVFENETYQICKDNRVTKLLVDMSGMGAFIPEDYQRMGLNVEGIQFTDKWKHDAYTYYNGLLGENKLKVHPKFSELLRQMKMQQMKPSNTHTPKYTEPSGDFDDQLWALILACWAARQYLTIGEARINQSDIESENRIPSSIRVIDN